MELKTLITSDKKSDQVDFSLIIPTYNESENIIPLVDKLSFLLEQFMPGRYELVIVDDDSPDRTWEIAQSLITQYPALRVIRRTTSRGLSSAIIHGWKESAGKILGVIDGDLQHPPTTLLQMLDEIQAGADLVVASRYISGGGVSNWHSMRRFLSRGAQLLGLLVLPEVLSQVSDPMSGYFIVCRDAISDKTLNPIGYKVLLEVLAKGNIKKISEVGYVFQERLEGETKVTTKHYIDYLQHLIKLRINLFGHLLKRLATGREQEIWPQPTVWLKILVISLIALGTFLRFTHLDQKAFCGDELWTAFAISGHTVVEVKQDIDSHEGPFSILSLNKYQRLNPDRGVNSTINYLVTSDPQHPPFYYAAVRVWAQLFDDSPASLRFFSALLSLLILPSVYWLCWELFESPTVGWLAMALMAVSPLQIFFAQESRQYSLWMATILVSTAALLRSIRRQTTESWMTYCLTTVLSLYTHLLTGLVLIAHGAYVFIRYRLGHRRILLSYSLTTLISGCLFLPWAIVLVRHINKAIELTSGWGRKLIDGPLELTTIYLARLSRPFFDFNFTSDRFWFNSFTFEGPGYYSFSSLLFGSIFIVLSGYFLITKLHKNKTNLLIILIGVFSSISLLAWDLTSGGVRSIRVKYQLPFYLFEEITLAYILMFGIAQTHIWKQRFWQCVLSMVIILGLVSDTIFLSDENWWIREEGQFSTQVGLTIRQSEISGTPLLIIDKSPVRLGDLLYLSHLLSKTDLLLITNITASSIPPEYDEIFLLEKNNLLFQALEQSKGYALDEIVTFPHPDSKGLWQFVKTDIS